MNGSIILASASESRAALLRDAGIVAEIHPAGVDESRTKDVGRREGWPIEAVARDLACEKATLVSRSAGAAWVIGADQMLECDGQWLDKAPTLEIARGQLLFLRGRTHRLVSAVAVVRRGIPEWTMVAEARLTMRIFSEDFLDHYLASCDSSTLGTVGGYRLEGRGCQLFSAIEGDYFTILGLPMLPLLAYLREAGALDT